MSFTVKPHPKTFSEGFNNFIHAGMYGDEPEGDLVG